MRLLTINKPWRLQDRRLEMVSEATGLHYNTVLYIKIGTAKARTLAPLRSCQLIY